MKKDLIIAISIGFLLGTVTAITVLNLPILIKTGKQTPQNSQALLVPKDGNAPSPMPGENGMGPVKLEITSPETESVAGSESMEIVGNTNPGNTVTITSDTDTEFGNADDKGKFSLKTSLAEGANHIRIAAYTIDGVRTEKQLVVYYTTEIL